METKKIAKDDRTTVEQTTSVLNFHSKLSLSMKSIQNQNFSEFPDDDFDLDDYDIIIKTKESQRFFIHFYASSILLFSIFLLFIFLFNIF